MLKLILRVFSSLGQPSPRPRRTTSTVHHHRHVTRRRVSTVSGTTRPVKTKTISGKCRVIDGDTIHIGNVRIRLAGIDAPELEHFWGQKAKWELVALCKGKKVTARLEPDLSYDRVVATCFLPDGRDLSAEMVKMGLALDWAKFSGGKYAPYEPEGV